MARGEYKNIIITILFVCLSLSLLYIFYARKVYSKNTSEVLDNVNELERSRVILQQELRITKADFENAKAKIRNKNSFLDGKDKIILKEQNEIQSILSKSRITNSELQKARRILLFLQSDINFYKEETKKLQNDNKFLTNINSKLVHQNSKLFEQKKSLEKNLSEEKKNKQNLLEDTNSTLSVSNYMIRGFTVKSSGREVETDRAKRINKIRVTLDLDKNLRANSKLKELFVTIHKPSGEICKFRDSKPGVITLRSGQKITYSDHVVVKYNNMSGARVSFDWTGNEFQKGEYKIDIYQNGYKIGQNSITLK